MLLFGFVMILVSLLLQSCCKAKEPLLAVQVIDVNGNDLLTDTNPSDSTWAIVENPSDKIGKSMEISVHDGKHSLLFPLYWISSGETFFLRVDATDVDTVKIDFKLKGRCDKKIIVDQIQYNDQVFDCGGRSDCVVVK